MISKLIEVIFGLPKLTEVECRVLDEVAAVLPPVMAGTMRDQIKNIRKIQRLDRGREVDFYYDADANQVPAFAFDQDVVELARVYIESLDTGHATRVCLQIVRGRLFSLNFTSPPRDLRGENLKVHVELCGLSDSK